MTFSPQLMAALRQSTQGGILELYGSYKVWPQFHCCISGNTVGVYKDPVAILIVPTQEECDNVPICVDISKSYSATSTIDLWEVDWGDGNTSNGNWPPPAWICHPTGGYAFPGIYDIVLTVTDILGATDSDAQQVNIVYCPPGPESLPGIVVGCYDYGAAYCDDLYIHPPVWNDLQSAELLTAGSKRILDMRFVKRHTDGKWLVYASTEDGIWEYDSMPGGTGHWSCVVTSSQIRIALGEPQFDPIKIWSLDNSLDTPGVMQAVCSGWAPYARGVVASLYTNDYWATFNAYIVKVQNNMWQVQWQSDIKIVQGSGGEEAWVAADDKAWYTANHGAIWTSILNTSGTNEECVHVPYVSSLVSGQRVWWAANNLDQKYYTDNGGAGWTAMTEPINRRSSRLWTSPHRRDLVEMYSQNVFIEWEDGVGWTVLYAIPTGHWGRDFLVTGRDPDEYCVEAVLVGDGVGGAASIILWTPLGAIDKLGNLTVLTGGHHCRAIAKFHYGVT